MPLGYQVWLLTVHYGLPFSQRLCNSTALASIIVYVACTLIAQLVMTLRIYAITMKDRTVTACFVVIMIAQFALGVYFTVLTTMTGADKVQSTIPDTNNTCVPVRRRPVELGFPAISLLYDLLAFLIVIYVMLHSSIGQVKMPSLFKTIAQDATRYFLVIFTSHLALELTLIFGRPTIQLLPATGIVVFLPVMVTRLMLSLKKASVSQREAWTFGEPGLTSAVGFVGFRGIDDGRDELRLDTLKSGHERAQSCV